MKQCPQCRTTYTDDTLKFCLADATLLSEIGEEETAVRSGMRVGIPPPQTVLVPHAPAAEKGFPVLKVVIALLVLGFLGLLVAGGAGVLIYMNSSGNAAIVTQNTPTPTPRPTAATPSATPDIDAEQERLEKELANVLKKLEEELGTNENRSAPTPRKGDVTDGSPTARVNSPGDGFLALRDEPNAETGTRLAKIPHGAVVALENCEKQRTTVSGRTGRWCMVTYEDDTGWVFDAWLDYQ